MYLYRAVVSEGNTIDFYPSKTKNYKAAKHYFPKALHKYDVEIRAHKLRREIIATQIVNELVNRMGPVFVASRMAKTGEKAEEVVKAFLIVMGSYGLEGVWKKIEALDNRVPAPVQLSALHEVFKVVKRAVTWFLRFGGENLHVETEIEAFRPGIDTLRKSIRKMVPDDVKASIALTESKLTEAGMPAAIANEIAVIKLLSSASDIVNISRKSHDPVDEIAPAYFMVGDHLGLDWLRNQVAGIVPANAWQARVMGGLMDDYFIHQAAITAAMFSSVSQKTLVDRKIVDTWFEKHVEMVSKINQLVDELREQPKVELEMLVLVSQRIGQLVHVVN